jgi:hypothetical protein
MAEEGSPMIEMDDTGTIDWFVVEFRGGRPVDGSLVLPILDLVDRRLIRILDALVFRKNADGVLETLSTNDLEREQHGLLGELAGATSGLIDVEDSTRVGDILEPNSAALMIVYENLWSLPFTRAAQMAGGELVASGRISVEAVVARLDQLGA